MGRKDVAYIPDGRLPSLKQEGNPAICHKYHMASCAGGASCGAGRAFAGGPAAQGEWRVLVSALRDGYVPDLPGRTVILVNNKHCTVCLKFSKQVDLKLKFLPPPTHG